MGTELKSLYQTLVFDVAALFNAMEMKFFTDPISQLLKMRNHRTNNITAKHNRTYRFVSDNVFSVQRTNLHKPKVQT